MKFLSLFLLPAFQLAAQQWVHFGPNHKLRYRTDTQGNRIMDFSSAGYKSGGAKLPAIAPATKLTPIPGDNTTQIQAAIDTVSRLATGPWRDSKTRCPDCAAWCSPASRRLPGSGHGWDVGWAVAWNVTSPYLLVQQPPGAMSWCIGCIGESVTAANLPPGIFDSPGTPVLRRAFTWSNCASDWAMPRWRTSATVRKAERKRRRTSGLNKHAVYSTEIVGKEWIITPECVIL